MRKHPGETDRPRRFGRVANWGVMGAALGALNSGLDYNPHTPSIPCVPKATAPISAPVSCAVATRMNYQQPLPEVLELGYQGNGAHPQAHYLS